MKEYIFFNIKKFKYKLLYKTLYNILISILGLLSILITKNIINYALDKDFTNLNISIIIFISLTIIMLILSPINSYISTILKFKIFDDIQSNLYKKVINSKFEKINKYSSLDIVNRINTDCGTFISFIYEIIPTTIGLILTIVLSIVALININYMFLIILLISSILTTILSRILNTKQIELSKEIQKNDVDHRVTMDESLKNIEYIKVSELEEINIDSLNKIYSRRMYLNKKMSIVVGGISFLFSLGSILSYTIIFVIGVYQLFIGNLSIAEFTVLLQIYRQLNSSVLELQSYIPSFNNVLAAIDRIYEIEILEPEDLKNKQISDFKEKIQFKNISFEYDDNKILSDLSFSIKKGDFFGIIGESGSGKTTFLKLMASLLTPKSGEILIDNNKLTNIHRSLISYVSQDDMLFTKSIKENLLCHNSQVSDSELTKVLYLTKIDSFLDKLPNGIHTNIKYLSKGQKQRIALARAILQKKPIILLDEVTASLDIDTEQHIINSIKNLDYKPTCFIVTHRNSILNICNKIYNIKNNVLTSQILN
ncbi:putative ABC transporter [Clostridium perfringens D str. JGS1721]|uniref:Putative ABC transporter n=1 Tax=Clostridium perfringens D str. JGS1721 TaxID=488537 RepID=B1V311_CLOPF|nr:ATP-binding cassette domain-containing protein [Clostridium perfringens]EDT71799.1 putative ABC transporter [Clostridium perfringens D str. JGS1721]